MVGAMPLVTQAFLFDGSDIIVHAADAVLRFHCALSLETEVRRP